MNPARHPSPSHWLDFVSGQMDMASRTLLEAHLAFCPECRDRAAEEAAPGAQVMAQESPEPAPQALLEAILARVKRPEPPRVGREVLPLPPVLWPLLSNLEGAAWRGALTRGFRFLVVPGAAGAPLYLIHMEKGRPFPRHGHRGLERSIILKGGLRDEDAILESGDFDEADASRIHTPIALPDEDCWLLASLDGGIHFTGWRGWLQALAPEN
jgi:putative transcriptional regulator